MSRLLAVIVFGGVVLGLGISDASAGGKAAKCAAKVAEARDKPSYATSRGKEEKARSMLDRAEEAAQNGKGKKCEKLLAKAVNLLEGN